MTQLTKVQNQVSGFNLLEMLDLEPPYYDDATQEWVFPSLPEIKGVIKM